MLRHRFSNGWGGGGGPLTTFSLILLKCGLLFCLFKGKINNNTNIHLDLQQIGCYCIQPMASYNNIQYCHQSR